ncbi:putative disease resistance protein RGA4 [Hordeum vulgare]|nr:putative disease resistance protein RGA4 [Hordeum vulgare]
MEDAFLEGAVQWRADTILQTLRMDKLDAWIRGAGLADDIEALKSEIDEVMATVSYVKGRAVGNRRLARSLAALKQMLFDADDAVDELDYYRLRHRVVEVEGGNLISRNGFDSNSSETIILIIPVIQLKKIDINSAFYPAFELQFRFLRILSTWSHLYVCGAG